MSVGINGCANLLEIEGLYKLQKMTEFDKMMMDLLHLFNLKALESSFEVEMIIVKQNQCSQKNSRSSLTLFYWLFSFSFFFPFLSIAHFFDSFCLNIYYYGLWNRCQYCMNVA